MTPPREALPDTPADTLSLKAAAERAGVSVSTVRRRRNALIAAGAEVSPTGWSIPAAALEAVFALPPDTPVEPPTDTPPVTHSERELIEQLRGENEFLRQQVEQQARTIERQAEAHAVISAQLTRIGQIEAGSESVPPTEKQRPAPRRRRWWQRR